MAPKKKTTPKVSLLLKQRKKVALLGLKGGIGKTTIAVNLAGEAHAQGLRVLLADADMPQRSASTWGDVDAERDRSGLNVIAVSAGFHRTIPDMAGDYDFTIIDCPPRGSVESRAALTCADLVVIPVGPDPFDIWSLAGTIDMINEAREIRPELRAVLVLNRLRPRQRLSSEAVEARDSLGLPMLKATIGLRTAFGEASRAGQSVATFAPKTAAAAEVRALFNEIQEVIRG